MKRQLQKKVAPKSILEEALEITTKDRPDSYDHPAENFERTAILWNAYLASRSVCGGLLKKLSNRDVAYMMVLFKMAREIHKPGRDNRIDMAGYVNCAQRIIDKESADFASLK
jgi:hypothetical protein